MFKRGLSVILSTIIVLGLFTACPFNNVHADSWSLNATDGWLPAYPSNNQNDYLEDQQTGSGSVSQDIVGNAVYPSTYMHFSTTSISFRVRVSNIDGTNPYQFKNFAFVGIDADLNGSVDFFMGVYNPTGNNGRLGIYSSSSGYANISPKTTGISGKPLMGFKPVLNSNYSITQASDGSNFNSDPDYFISFTFSVADISNALAGTKYTFTSSTPFAFMTGTAAQDNSFNQDINGMDSSGWSSGNTWSSLGVYSNIVSPDGNVTYYAVTFDKNTGDTEASPVVMAVLAGRTLGSLPVPPTKRGLNFQEWNTSPDGTGSTITSSTIINSNLTAYAIWSDKLVCTVTFNTNSGTWSDGTTTPVSVNTINGIVGDSIPIPPTQSKKYFMGWYTTSTGTGGSWFNSTTLVTSNTTVYAQWANSDNKVAIFYDNFNVSGGSVVAEIYSNGNSNNFNGTLPTISRTGYIFGGWFLNDITCSGTAVTGITSPGKYYAKWISASYTVSFNANAGTDTVTGMPTQRVVSNGVFGIMPSPEPTRAGYEFIEWNKNPDGSGEAMYPTSIITANTTVYAMWKAYTTVIFHSNTTPDQMQAIKQVNGVLDYLPQPPSKDGYTFLGWSTSPDNTTIVNLQNVTGYTNLYAVWSPVYNVIFNTNGGNWGDGSTITTVGTAYGSVLYIPEVPTRNNYIFVGWNTSSDGLGMAFTISSPVTVNNLTVYAIWTPETNVNVVKFVSNGGSNLYDVATNSIDSMPISTRIGYTLEGWYTDPTLNANSKIDYPYDVTSNITLYAKWTADNYVTLNDNGGTGGSGVVRVAHNQPMPAANIPIRDGYKFLGYFDSLSSGTQYYDANMNSIKNWDKTASNTTLYASWQSTSDFYIVNIPETVVLSGNSSVDIDISSELSIAPSETLDVYITNGIDQNGKVTLISSAGDQLTSTLTMPNGMGITTATKVASFTANGTQKIVASKPNEFDLLAGAYQGTIIFTIQVN